MLRRVLLVWGCCLLIAGTVLLGAAGNLAGLALMANGLILILALISERFRYKPTLSGPPGAGWQPTGEKSADARGVVSVWFKPASGERAYVREPGSPPAA